MNLVVAMVTGALRPLYDTAHFLSYDWLERRLFWADDNEIIVYSMFINGTGLHHISVGYGIGGLLVHPCRR